MTEYDVKLSRSHETMTNTKTLGDRDIEVPLHQDVIVRFDAETDLFSADEQTVLACVLPSVAPNPTLPLEGWRPWKAVLLREAYDFALPAPVRVPEDSPAGRLLASSLGRYPSLYRADAFAPYRVFEHWFCTIGNGLDWHQGILTDGSEQLPEVLTAEEQAKELADRERFTSMHWSQQLLLAPPVKLYPLSAGYSLLYELPADVDDSFLMAAFQLCEYLLDRPVWQNHAYSPADLTGTDRSPAAAIWKSDDWRHVALADGMKYRTLVEQAYARLVLGVWRRRMKDLGFEDRGRRLDYSLPPRARRFSRT